MCITQPDPEPATAHATHNEKTCIVNRERQAPPAHKGPCTRPSPHTHPMKSYLTYKARRIECNNVRDIFLCAISSGSYHPSSLPSVWGLPLPFPIQKDRDTSYVVLISLRAMAWRGRLVCRPGVRRVAPSSSSSLSDPSLASITFIFCPIFSAPLLSSVCASIKGLRLAQLLLSEEHAARQHLIFHQPLLPLTSNR